MERLSVTKFEIVEIKHVGHKKEIKIVFSWPRSF